MELRGFAFALLIVLADCLASSRGLPSHHQGKNDKYDRREMVGKTDKLATANDQAVRSSKDIKVPRIVGGEELCPHDWPFLVVVGYISHHGDYNIYCGGTIIDKYHVVTAAHCLDKKKYYIEAGVHNVYENEESQQTRLVEKIFIHPRYDPKRDVHDVAVLRLSEPLDWTNEVDWIDLNQNKRCPSHHAMCEVAGWGSVSEDDEGSEVPLKIELPVRSKRTCSSSFDDYYPDAELCAGPGEGNTDPCYGDSGGPLVCPCGDEGDRVLTGIVSYGYKCGKAGVPEVFTRVSSYFSFINDTIHDTSH